MREATCYCGHRMLWHNGDTDDDRCTVDGCDCWKYRPTFDPPTPAMEGGREAA